MSDYIKGIFDQSGPVARAMPNYEIRAEQIEMAEAVNSAIFDSETLVVEAGTGVGKSFSYLIPVARHASENESLAIVSTHTISLQEQIVHKDIPFLEKALDKDFKANNRATAQRRRGKGKGENKRRAYLSRKSPLIFLKYGLRS